MAHSLVVIIYPLLRNKKPYRDLGADFFAQMDARRIEQQAVARLEQVGFQVALTRKQEVAWHTFPGEMRATKAQV